jgi:non-canonical poly(A) RNA polymerase PAPD5/7
MLNKNDNNDFISNSNNMNSLLSNNFNENINKNVEHMNQSQINSLKSNLYNKYLNNPNINFNIEIPVEFQSNTRIYTDKKNNPINLRKFLKQNKTPLLHLDLSKKSELDLELKVLKLNEQLKEKVIKILEMKKKIQKLEDEIIKNEEINSKKDEELKYYNNLNKQDKKVIKELNNNKNELINKIHPDHIFLNSNKNVSLSEYRNLKFKPQSLELNYLYKALQKDLIDYEKYINYLISKKIPKIEKIINELKLIIEDISPDYEIKIYGSYAHGLSFPWSDLNLIIVKKNENYKNKENSKEDNITEIETTVGEKSVTNEIQSQNDNISTTQELNKNDKDNNNNKEKFDLLLKLYNNIEKKNWKKALKINDNENINTITLEVSEDNFKIEINICIESKIHYGLKVVELIKSYIKEYSVLKPLTLALGAILEHANLNVSSTGGLTSYGLILMIVSFIQSQRENINFQNEEYIIGKTFYEFLFHYGIKFDFNKYVILTYKINDTNTLLNDKYNQFNLGQNAKEFMIMDPLNHKNNVAKSTFQFMNLKMAFMISFLVTCEDCECGCHYGKAFYENSICSTEHCYLKRMFNSVKRFTEPGK